QACASSPAEKPSTTRRAFARNETPTMPARLRERKRRGKGEIHAWRTDWRGKGKSHGPQGTHGRWRHQSGGQLGEHRKALGGRAPKHNHLLGKRPARRKPLRRGAGGGSGQKW